MLLDEARSQARKALTEAVDAANARHREHIEHIVATSEGPYDTAFAGAHRARQREVNQAWRDYRFAMAEARKAARDADL